MSTFLLDTNVFAALASSAPNARLLRAFEKHEAAIVTASLVLHELSFGIERLPRSKKRDHLERFLTEVVGGLRILPYGERAARWHASERARLAAIGRTPPFVDGQIAAVAAVHDATLVTSNVTDFAMFDGLRVEDWSASTRR